MFGALLGRSFSETESLPASLVTGKAPGGTSRKFGGVRAEVSGKGPGLLRSCLAQQVLNVGAYTWELESVAGKRQESATFLQHSFFNVALQFFAWCSAAFGQNDIRTAEKPMLQCNFCSAAFRKLQRNFCFRFWHVAGVGFRGVGFGTVWDLLTRCGISIRSPSKATF